MLSRSSEATDKAEHLRSALPILCCYSFDIIRVNRPIIKNKEKNIIICVLSLGFYDILFFKRVMSM